MFTLATDFKELDEGLDKEGKRSIVKKKKSIIISKRVPGVK